MLVCVCGGGGSSLRVAAARGVDLNMQQAASALLITPAAYGMCCATHSSVLSTHTVCCVLLCRTCLLLCPMCLSLPYTFCCVFTNPRRAPGRQHC